MKYQTIVLDPPWQYPEGFSTASRWWRKGVRNGPVTHKLLPYPSLSLAEIAALPVRELADADCRLFCWTTNRYLPDAFRLLEGWGFRYRQTLVWHKRDGNMGGSVAPNSAEFLLVATSGKPAVTSKWASSVIATGSPKRHSGKPETFLDMVETVSPGPYLELFARRQRMGWDTWGNECFKAVAL